MEMVMWFSDQKGFSFITPDDGGLVTKRVSILLLIIYEGFCSLVDGGPIEFDVELGNACCTKVINNTGPDDARVKGGSCGGGYGGGDH
ncbi:hypothetical protein MTR67_001437 [Solanum verrucosum]|uniref:Uncharacterized protein n=1 Tax=Solanum verrucosum TaxID=315347 RepID=A0AAF0PNM8_SOLVR|nr:hypothetical protein MTR67_001437 [Solanum verrucosum]